MSNILASMTIALGSDTKHFVSGMKNAATHLTMFQNNADKLKGVDLSKMTADFSKQTKSLVQLQSEARRLGTSLRLATDEKSIKLYNTQLERTQAEMSRIRALGRTGLGGVTIASGQAARGMGELAGSASTVNMEFARIIQDAPFGMMGIGNNIQQLTANFGQLKQQAGSTGAAISATLASMITPASLLTLGIAAVTSGWVLYDKWAQKSAKASREAADGMQTAEQAAEEYIASLDALAKGRAKGEREAQKELAALKLLYDRTQNTTLSIKERRRAVDELQKQYPAYFKNLSDEEVLAGKAANAYSKLSASILEYAQAQANLSLIEQRAQQVAVNKLRLKDLEEQQKKQEQAITTAEELKKAQDAANASFNSGRGSAGSVLGAQSVYNLKNALDETKQSITDIISENRKLAEEMELLAPGAAPALFDENTGKAAKEQLTVLQELEKGFDAATKQAIIFGSSFDEMGAKSDLFKAAIIGLMAQGVDPNEEAIQRLKNSYDFFSGQTLPKAGAAIQRFIKQDLGKLQEQGEMKLPPPVIAPPSPEFIALNNKMVNEAVQKMVEIDKDVINLEIEQAVEASLGNIGEVIGVALAGQKVAAGDFVAAALTPFADMSIQLGKYAIGIGVGIEAIKNALRLMNPAVAIAAGVALVTMGTAVKSNLSNMASGGSMAPSISTGGSSYRPAPNLGTSFSGPDELVARVTADQLEFLLSRNAYKNRRVRGNG